ncbi:MAG: glycosyltransferase family 2 protein [Candidatus Latescibacterota bacterium]|nr:glycosyltransferase family 2 protein [Candidatus Latescibacterota bacterium]
MVASPLELSVILPAYNEEGAIARVVGALRQRLDEEDSLRERYEILVIDDGSSDDTAQQARSAGGDIRVVQHPYNIGNGAAVKTGIRHARGRVLVFMDADGQHDPGQVPEFLRACSRYDMVVGARGRGSQAGLHRSLANGLYNALASYVTGRRIHDLTSGFRAIRRDVARRFAGLLPNGFSYPTTITLCLMRAGHSVLYQPIEAAKRTGKSKIRLFSDGTKFLMVIAKICMLFAPMKIFLPVSVYLFLMGLGYYGYTFQAEHRFTNMSMLLFTTSVVIFMMGLLAEQIAQLRFERTEEAPSDG